MERLYQHFSLEAPTSEDRVNNESAAVPSAAAAAAPSQLPSVPGLRDKLQQSLLGVADNLLNCYSPNVSR